MDKQKKYLFTLTITPVQSFISQARKTKDLFVGSEILSDLMQKVRDKFDEDEIIFPQNEVSLSNKIVVEIYDISKEIEEIEKFINNEFYLIGSRILTKIMIEYNLSINTNFLVEHFQKQLCNFFQIFWVAIKYNKDKTYQENYKQLEYRLGAVKNLRTFEQLEQTSGRKCSVCGERNGLFYKYQLDKNNKLKKPKYIVDNAIAIKTEGAIKENETLCAVCFTKRFYEKENKDYPSTAKIALLDWLENLDYENLKRLKYENENFDEQWFFEYDKKDKNTKEAFENWLKNNEDILKDRKKKKYYALLKFDIDNMGKILSGLDKEKQIELSKHLGTFAQKAKELVDNHGKTIYAGGDDFLGFVNLAYLFKVIERIRKVFNDKVKTSFSDLSFSIGIVIAHYKEPLHIVLDRARRVEKIAKKIDKDKNGLAISVLKHSGEIIETRIKNSIENIQNISKIIKLIEKDFSDKFIINLELEFRALIDNSDRLMVKKEMVEIELRRLIQKSLIDKKETNKIDELFTLLTPFVEHRAMSNFFNLLDIVRFMKRGLK